MLERKHRAVLLNAQARAVGEIDNMRACFELLAVASAIDRDCAARLMPLRLSEGKFVLLLLLLSEPSGLSPHELADKAGVTRATITGLLDGLERDRLITRRASVDDRRKIVAALTGPGRKTAQKAVAEHSAWITSLLAGLAAEDRRALHRLLQRIWRNLSAGSEAKDQRQARS